MAAGNPTTGNGIADTPYGSPYHAFAFKLAPMWCTLFQQTAFSAQDLPALAGESRPL